MACFALAAAVAAVMFWRVDFRQEETTPFFALIATIAGTLLGFAMTSLAILVSVSDSKLLNSVKKVGLYETLVRGIYAAATSLFLTLAASVALFFYANNFSMTIVIFLFALSLMLLLNVGWKFFTVLEFLGEPEGDRSNID